MKSNGIAGKTAFVTGSGGGIGEAVVRQLLDEGARVVATDLNKARLTELFGKHGDAVLCADLDVRDSAAVDALVDRADREFGAIDFGVNVAGILTVGAVADTDDATWRNIFAVNTDGVFHVSRALARRMIPRRSGAIVTVSSNAASIPRFSLSAYAATKAATTMFTRCLGLELAQYGIRCNIVAPGSVLTPMQTNFWTDEFGEKRAIEGSLETFRNGIPLRKLATPGDIADAVIFLLSDRASQITMTDIYVDGGATLRG